MAGGTWRSYATKISRRLTREALLSFELGAEAFDALCLFGAELRKLRTDARYPAAHGRIDVAEVDIGDDFKRRADFDMTDAVLTAIERRIGAANPHAHAESVRRNIAQFTAKFARFQQ